jgi:hypothetical protein
LKEDMSDKVLTKAENADDDMTALSHIVDIAA